MPGKAKAPLSLQVNTRGSFTRILPCSVSLTNMAESELNIDSLISRLLEGTVAA